MGASLPGDGARKKPRRSRTIATVVAVAVLAGGGSAAAWWWGRTPVGASAVTRAELLPSVAGLDAPGWLEVPGGWRLAYVSGLYAVLVEQPGRTTVRVVDLRTGDTAWEQEHMTSGWDGPGVLTMTLDTDSGTALIQRALDTGEVRWEVPDAAVGACDPWVIEGENPLTPGAVVLGPPVEDCTDGAPRRVLASLALADGAVTPIGPEVAGRALVSVDDEAIQVAAVLNEEPWLRGYRLDAAGERTAVLPEDDAELVRHVYAIRDGSWWVSRLPEPSRGYDWRRDHVRFAIDWAAGAAVESSDSCTGRPEARDESHCVWIDRRDLVSQRVVDGEVGEEEWRLAGVQPRMADLVTPRDGQPLVLASTDADRLVALDAATGEARWTWGAGLGGDEPTLVAIGSRLYVGTTLDGASVVVELDLATGAELARVVGGAELASANGVVSFVNGQSTRLALVKPDRTP